MQLCEYTKNNLIVHFKWVNWVICELYLNKAVIFFNWLVEPRSYAYTLAAKKHGKVTTIWLFQSSSYQNSYDKNSPNLEG